MAANIFKYTDNITVTVYSGSCMAAAGFSEKLLLRCNFEVYFLNILFLGRAVDSFLLLRGSTEQIKVFFEVVEVDILANFPTNPHILRILDVI